MFYRKKYMYRKFAQRVPVLNIGVPFYAEASGPCF